MIRHTIQRFNANSVAKTMVVVAPRILLAQQLCDDFLGQIDNVDVLHVHSGKGQHLNTTKINEINNWYHNSIKNQIIFTTYHSLHKLMDSEIEVDTIYFDEAHNSTTKSFSLLQITSLATHLSVISLQQHLNITIEVR